MKNELNKDFYSMTHEELREERRRLLFQNAELQEDVRNETASDRTRSKLAVLRTHLHVRNKREQGYELSAEEVSLLCFLLADLQEIYSEGLK